jgi:hypothetical protein
MQLGIFTRYARAARAALAAPKVAPAPAPVLIVSRPNRTRRWRYDWAGHCAGWVLANTRSEARARVKRELLLGAAARMPLDCTLTPA